MGRGQVEITADFVKHDDLGRIEISVLEHKQRAHGSRSAATSVFFSRPAKPA
jgi:hypothetical protein